VWSIGYGMSPRGFFPEIQVWVKDTTKIPSIRAKIPDSVDGISVAVIPPLTATYGEPTDPTIRCPEQSQAYLQAVKENWGARIPGVFGLGPSKCDSHCCYYDRIGVEVQIPFIESLRAKVPREICGLPVDVVPFQWPPPDKR